MTTAAIELQPGNFENYFNRGIALFNKKKKDLEGALADYTKTIEIEQTHALAFANRGVVKVLLKKSDAAADFETAFRLNPSLKARYGEFYEKRRQP